MAAASRMILKGENLFEKGIVIVNWCCTSKKSADTVFWPLTSVFGGWSNILLEEHGSQEAERAFENHELESIYFALWAKIKRS